MIISLYSTKYKTTTIYFHYSALSSELNESFLGICMGWRTNRPSVSKDLYLFIVQFVTQSGNTQSACILHIVVFFVNGTYNFTAFQSVPELVNENKHMQLA